LRGIARRFGLPNHTYVSRHRDRHLPPELVAVKRANGRAESDALEAVRRSRELEGLATAADQVEALIGRARLVLDRAEDGEKATLVLAATRELRMLVELLAKLRGELDERPLTAVNLITNPDWLAVRAAVIDALQPYPEAGAAVASRLLLMESGGRG
jgi:hypothetical protein